MALFTLRFTLWEFLTQEKEAKEAPGSQIQPQHFIVIKFNITILYLRKLFPGGSDGDTAGFILPPKFMPLITKLELNKFDEMKNK